MIKVDIGTLPYQLAFRKFKLANGLPLTKLSFKEQVEVQQKFDKLYKF